MIQGDAYDARMNMTAVDFWDLLGEEQQKVLK